jgi:hypothetical protein
MEDNFSIAERLLASQEELCSAKLLNYQRRIKLVKAGSGNLLANPYTILNRKKKIVSVSYSIYIELCYAVHETGFHEVEIVIKIGLRYASSDTYQTLTKLIQAIGKTLHSGIHKSIYSIWY